MRASALAEALGASLAGASDVEITGLARLEDAGPAQAAFALAPRYRRALRATRAGVVVVAPTLLADAPALAVALVPHSPESALGVALRAFAAVATQAQTEGGVHPSAVVDPTAVVASNARVDALAYVGPGAVIGDAACVGVGAVVDAGAVVGAGTRLGPRVVLHGGVRLGARCVVGAGAVLGGVGFGFDAEGRLPHLGGLVVEDDVHIGANACVDRGTIGDTCVSAGARIDNLVQVGHNARVGARAVLCGLVGLAGGARIEDDAVLGGQAGVAGGAVVGARARVAAQSGVTHALAPDGEYSGHPAEPNRPRLVRLARLRRMAERPT